MFVLAKPRFFFLNPKGMFCGFKLKLKLLHVKKISGMNFFCTKSWNWEVIGKQFLQGEDNNVDWSELKSSEAQVKF